MKSLNVLALILGLAGVGVGGYALSQQKQADPSDVNERVTELQEQVDRLTRRLDAQSQDRAAGPLLSGVPSLPTPVPSATDDTASNSVGDDSVDVAPASDGPASPEAIRTLVDKAVAKKAEQLQTMRNKKPSLGVFAKTLELTEDQQEAAKSEILDGQRGIRELLETVSDEGTNFLDEVVDVMADGMARPGKNPGRWGKLFGQLTTQKVPGTDETYAVAIEAVKQRVRDSFKRTWTPQQYATFESWQMDPTEVQGIEGSPWTDLEQRIKDRAQQMGADIDDK